MTGSALTWIRRWGLGVAALALAFAVGGYLSLDALAFTDGGADDEGSMATEVAVDEAARAERESAMDDMIACVEDSGIVQAMVTEGEGLRPTRVTWSIPSGEDTKHQDLEAGREVIDACEAEHMSGVTVAPWGYRAGGVSEEEAAEVVRDTLQRVEVCMEEATEVPDELSSQPFIAIPGSVEALRDSRPTIAQAELPLYQACAIEVEAQTGITVPGPLFEERPGHDPLGDILDTIE